MKNRIFLKSHLLMLGLIFALVVSGCNEEKNTLDSSSSADFEGAEFAILDFDDAMESLSDATLDNDFSFGNFPVDGGFAIGFGNRNGFRPLFRGRHLRPVFDQLQLTSGQLDLIKVVLEDHRECMRAGFESLREANREIIQSANQERRSIHQQVADNLITREEAHELIHQLNVRTREAIRNNPDTILAHEEMCACRLTLFDATRLLLDDTQLIIWDEWVAGLEDPCFTSE